MQKLDFSYSMELVFSQAVSKHQFTLRMLPHSDGRQQVEKCDVKILPECALDYGEDAFGNLYVYGDIEHEHTCFEVVVQGEVNIIGNGDKVKDEGNDVVAFRYPSKFTRAGEKLKEYYAEHGMKAGENKLEFTNRLLHQLYRDMEYKPGVTNVQTLAEEAITIRQGVCQDYAQIMISLCRMADIPSRYVVGMMKGEGYSHAWAEVYIDGYWYGMDPTNDRTVDDTYIKISHGRDYQDCIVNRGVFRGTGQQIQNIKVVVSEADKW